MVAGLTPEQVKHKLDIEDRLLHEGLHDHGDAALIVSKRFYVAAINPLYGGFIVRAMPYRGDLTLFEVWASIGSPSTSLDDDAHIKVIRADPRHPVVKVINIREMLMCGYSGGNIQIKSERHRVRSADALGPRQPVRDRDRGAVHRPVCDHGRLLPRGPASRASSRATPANRFGGGVYYGGGVGGGPVPPPPGGSHDPHRGSQA